MKQNPYTIPRRDFLQTAAGSALTGGAIFTGGCATGTTPSNRSQPNAKTVRDCLWVWSHPAGSHNTYKLKQPSRMTPAEGAFYLDVPNILLIRYDYEQPYPLEQYLLSFRPLDRVVVSIVGAGGLSNRNEEIETVLQLAERYPNLSGAIMDDFFHPPDAEGRVATFSAAELADIHQQLNKPGNPLDLWAVLYAHQMDLPVTNHLKHCDVIAFWTWLGSDLKNLQQNFERLESKVPNKRIVLGCYIFDYGENHEMPIDRMQHQCELGLQWLHEERIEGMIFLATNVFDVGLETVEWTRQWIAKVGKQRL